MASDTIDSNELTLKSLCQAAVVVSLPSSPSDGSSGSTSVLPLPYVVQDEDEIDIPRIVLPVNRRYRLIAFGDASFAIGELKQSVSGFTVYLNGVPLLWGSLKQTIVCSGFFLLRRVRCREYCFQTNSQCREYDCFLRIDLPETVPTLHGFHGVPPYCN